MEIQEQKQLLKDFTSLICIRHKHYKKLLELSNLEKEGKDIRADFEQLLFLEGVSLFQQNLVELNIRFAENILEPIIDKRTGIIKN